MAWTVRVGTVASGFGAITPGAPAGHATDDIDLLIIEHSGENDPATLTTANGFAAVTGGTIRTGVGPGASVAAASVYWRRWNGTDGDPTGADQGNHQQAVILSFAGGITSGDPWDQVATGTQTATTSVSIGGATATVTASMVVAISGGSLPDAISTTEFSSAANTNLTSVTERIDNTIDSGNGGALLVITGELAGADAWGATTATAATSGTRANIALNLKPPVAAAGKPKTLLMLGVG